MRLAVKLVLWFFACVVLAVGINGYMSVRSELERYEADLAARHVVMGRVLREAFGEVMDTDGEARAVSMLETTDKRLGKLVDVRWVHLEPDASAARKPLADLSKLAPLHDDRDVHDKADGRLRSYIPMHLEGHPLTALEFSESLEGEDVVVHRFFVRESRAVAIVAIAVGIAATLLGVLLIARPMRRLVTHAQRIGKGDLSPMRVSSNDEIGALGAEMNAMCTQLSTALGQLRRAERLSTVGQLASGLAHELGTPLNVITLRAKAVAQGRAKDEAAQEAAKSIVDQAQRMTNLVRQLLDFARRKPPQRDVVAVDEIAERTTNLVEAVAKKARVSLRTRLQGDIPSVRGDASQLEQVFTNLLVNAIHASPNDGEVKVTTSVAHVSPPADLGGAASDFVKVSIADHGSGIAPDVLPRVFEPFFTTKDVGEGTGLGLAVCYGIVRDHGGFIDIETEVGKGTEVIVFLPVQS